jgi:hypothetical protein
MISTRVYKSEVIAQLIPVIDMLSLWYKEHADDVNSQYSRARFQKRRIENKIRTATQIYRLCTLKGDPFISIDTEHVEAFESLMLENIRAEIKEYARLREIQIITTERAIKPAVTCDENQRAHDAVLWSLLIVTVSLIGIFA